MLTHACAGDSAARARAVSLWTAAGSVTLAAGPLIGGVLVDTLGWRSIFLVNVPIGIASVWWTRRTIAEAPPRDGALDLAGQVLALLMLVSLTGAIIEAGHQGVANPLVIAGFVTALLCFGGFIWREAKSSDPMLPLGFFRDATFSAATFVGLAVNLTLYGTVFVLGLYLQQVLQYSPVAAGFAFLPLPIALGIANIAAGPIGHRFGLRMPMVMGLVIGAAGYSNADFGNLRRNESYSSGRPVDGGGQSQRGREPCGIRKLAVVAEAESKHPFARVVEEPGKAAAIPHDGKADFVPEGPIEKAGRNAEFMADIDDNGADRPATHFGGDLRLGGQAREPRVLGVGLRLGIRRRDPPRNA